MPSIGPLKYQRPGTPTSYAQSGEAMTVKIRYKQPGGGARNSFG